jgi:tetratricopeptide (TPR) repeat protein
MEDYSAALELDPSNAAAYNHRGYAWRQLGRCDAAVADYSRSLELEPDNIKTLNNRGYSYAKASLFDAAISDYSRVIALDPANAHAYHNRGISYDKQGLYEAAIAGAVTARVRCGRLLSARAAAPAVSCSAQRHCSPSRCAPSAAAPTADFTRVLELDASNANAYFNRGSTHDSLGAYDKAISDYSRALDLDRQAQQANGGGSSGGGGGSGPSGVEVPQAASGAGGRATSPGAGSRGGAPSPGAGEPLAT